MALPTTRELLKQYCLRKLGKPVITINADDTQLEDRLDEALLYYRNYHFDGTIDEDYYSITVSASDVTNEYITIPDTILEVKGIVSLDVMSSVDQQTYKTMYQLTQTVNSGSMIGHYLTQTNINFVNDMLSANNYSFSANKVTDKLLIHQEWGSDIVEGDILLLKVATIIDPEVYPEVYSDQWLIDYTTALFQEQWGSNLSKFEEVKLPGGITLNGGEILQKAEDKITELQEQMRDKWSEPPMGLIG